MVNKRGTIVEGYKIMRLREKATLPEERTKSISVVNDEEENAKSSSVPGSTFHIGLEGRRNVFIVKFTKNLLGSKGLCGTNSGDDFFRESSSFSHVLKRQPVIKI